MDIEYVNYFGYESENLVKDEITVLSSTTDSSMPDLCEEPPKTIFCNLDGTLLFNWGDMTTNCKNPPLLLEGALDSIHKWENAHYTIVITTNRKECLRRRTEEQLCLVGIVYDVLIMGLPLGSKIVINKLS
jgi:hypothetical protein